MHFFSLFTHLWHSSPLQASDFFLSPSPTPSLSPSPPAAAWLHLQVPGWNPGHVMSRLHNTVGTAWDACVISHGDTLYGLGVAEGGWCYCLLLLCAWKKNPPAGTTFNIVSAHSMFHWCTYYGKWFYLSFCGRKKMHVTLQNQVN